MLGRTPRANWPSLHADEQHGGDFLPWSFDWLRLCPYADKQRSRRCMRNRGMRNRGKWKPPLQFLIATFTIRVVVFLIDSAKGIEEIVGTIFLSLLTGCEARTLHLNSLRFASRQVHQNENGITFIIDFACVEV